MTDRLANIDPDSPVTIGGLKLGILRDSIAGSPWDSGDWLTPFAYTTGGDIEAPQYHGSDAILDPVSDAPDSWFDGTDAAPWCEALGMDRADFDRHMSEVAEGLHDCGEDCKLADARALFREILDDMRPATALHTLAWLWNARGVHALVTRSTGYCQGEVAHILTVQLEPWRARVGAPADREHALRDMAGCAETIGAYLWGDCWGWFIEDDDTSEVLESCLGYWGAGWGDDPYGGALGELRNTAIDQFKMRKKEKMAETESLERACTAIGRAIEALEAEGLHYSEIDPLRALLREKQADSADRENKAAEALDAIEELEEELA